MSELPGTRPLDSDALRIQQLKEKLAEVQGNGSFFARRSDVSRSLRPTSPISPGTIRTGPSLRAIDDAAHGEAKHNFVYGTSDRPLNSASTQQSSSDSLGHTSNGRRRQAPVIKPATHRLSSSLKHEGRREIPNFLSLAPSSPESSLRRNLNSVPRTAPDSEVVPFLYQDLGNLKHVSPVASPMSEVPNPFDAAFPDNKSLNGISSPLNPHNMNHTSASGNAGGNSRGRGRRDATDLTAVVPPGKQSRGFLNSFMHKRRKEEKSEASQERQQSSEDDGVSHEHFTSPFEQQARARTSTHASSLSLRLPLSRRQTLNVDGLSRLKKSIVSTDQSPGTSIGASGVILDTDLTHMAGIVKPSADMSLPKVDFSFENTHPDVSVTSGQGDFAEAAWAPPESWAVRRPEDIARDEVVLDEPDPLEGSSTSDKKEMQVSTNTSNSELTARRGPNHQMRVFRGDWTFATLACGLHTTTETLMSILGRKFFLPSVANYQILLERNGLSRILQSWEKPFLLQKTLLEEAGYTQQDRLEEIGREDNSYLCRFIFTTCSVPSFSLDTDTTGGSLDAFDLSGRNVQSIPIVLYKHAGTLRSLDVSRNLSLDIPMDFIQSCIQLQSLVCTHNEMSRIPANVMHARALLLLDASFNRITELHDNMGNLQDLISLILRNNKLQKLPKIIIQIQSLQRLNLSSNLITTFPGEICELRNLEDLDLSFNRINALPEKIGNLTKLQRLLINNNRLIGTLPRAFSKLCSLREVDIRFNLLTTLDVLSQCPLLESISAGHNAVTVVESQFPSARLFHLNKCPVTKFTLLTCGLTLTSLDLSNAKLPSIPDAMFDNLTNLIKLVLDNNHFTYLPPQLGKLTRLQHLSCTSNQLSVLPEEIGNLLDLRVLDVHSNNLKAIPIQTWHLAGLISLNASSNLLNAFPAPPIAVAHKESSGPIGLSPVVEEHTFPESGRKNSTASTIARSGNNTMARSLKYLFLGDNRMDEQCFESISLLQELRVLNLSFNEIYEIPHSGLRRLHHLVELYLSGNELTSLPADDLEEMQTLRVLHVNANKLQTLPAEIGKIRRLLVLDVGSNALKYNTANWPYDWNWNWNLDLKYLNLSGNKRLEIKPSNNTNVRDRNLSDFNALTKLRVLGLMDITLTIDSVPEENENRRVRLSGSDISNIAYGQADTMGRHDHLSTIDMVLPRFQGHDDEIIFGMFDGSEVQGGGSKVAKHLQDFIVEHLAIELKRLRKDEGVPSALRRAFLAFNKELGVAVTPTPVNKKDSDTPIPKIPGSHRPSVISQSSTFAGPYMPVALGAADRTSGAAVCMVYLVGKKAYIANVGDSLAVLSRADGEARLLSVKHNAGVASEVQRIREAGGYVSRDGLVNDQLDVTRSIGYFHLTPLIQAAPHVETIDLSEEDEFIIIASKSLWEVMSFQTAVDIARSEHEDLMLAAQKLRDFAITYGAPNKISVMIIGVGDLFHRKSKLLKIRNASAVRGAGGGFFVADDDLLLGHKTRRRANDDQPADSTLARLTREVPPPVGDVAMIFTDIKNSTLLWETHPVAMRSAIKIHNGIMRRQLRSIGGYEVKTEGDAFMVCFPTVTSALLWCLTVQTQLLVADWPQEILESKDGQDIYDEETGELLYRGISVRMGMHWGSPVCEVDPITRRMDYFGPMVNRAARISGVADGGQITVSADVVRDIEVLEQLHRNYTETITAGKTVDDPSEEQTMLAIRKDMQMLQRIGFAITPLGERRLKGLENAEFISLAYPKSLAGRLSLGSKLMDAERPSFVGPRALDHRHIVDVYTVVFRLENLCSTLRGNKTRTENRVKVLREMILKAYTNEDDDMRLAAVLENLLTRVENAMAALTLHYSQKTSNALMASSGLSLAEIMQAIQDYKTRVQ